MKRKVVKRGVPYEEGLLERLKDPEIAAYYLDACLDDDTEDREAIVLTAIKNVAKARGLDLSALAKGAELNRENLYRTLRRDGNPKIQTLSAILDQLDMRLGILPKRRMG